MDDRQKLQLKADLTKARKKLAKTKSLLRSIVDNESLPIYLRTEVERTYRKVNSEIEYIKAMLS